MDKLKPLNSSAFTSEVLVSGQIYRDKDNAILKMPVPKKYIPEKKLTKQVVK
jgi:hypothetical protein